MTKISIDKESDAPFGWQFVVSVVSTTSTTEHTVAVAKEDWKSLTEEKVTPQELITKSFEFLLGRESNESILRNFNITDITRYYPDFPGELKKILST
jgi:hypothetical protein